METVHHIHFINVMHIAEMFFNITSAWISYPTSCIRLKKNNCSGPSCDWPVVSLVPPHWLWTGGFPAGGGGPSADGRPGQLCPAVYWCWSQPAGEKCIKDEELQSERGGRNRDSKIHSGKATLLIFPQQKNGDKTFHVFTCVSKEWLLTFFLSSSFSMGSTAQQGLAYSMKSNRAYLQKPQALHRKGSFSS